MSNVVIKPRRVGFWSQKFDQCIECETKEIKHFAKGLCQKCYACAYREYQRKNKAE